MAWKGNISNPAPNAVQEPIDRSEKMIADNRAEQVRRDTDTQKNFTITLYDIDETILSHLEQLQLQVIDVGKQVKVPIFYGSPERWVSAQRDGYIRDKQGKLILPAIVFKRTSSENDTALQFFNRYLNTSVIKLYTEKNQYTQFSQLTGQNAPVNEVYNIVIPSHMVLVYHFILWTESVEQMNKLVETIQFNTKDYWGSKKGFRFRTKTDPYSHTVELQANEDRVVKTEFDLTVNGYILPDSMTKLDRHSMTTNKVLTPKKLIMGMEVVSTGYNMKTLDKNREKWRNPKYANIQKDVVIPGPSVSVNTNIVDNSYGIKVDNSPLFLRMVPVPTTQADKAQDGSMSYDSQYFYFHTDGVWKRVAIAEFILTCSDSVPVTNIEGKIVYSESFLYIYSKGIWKKVAISEFDINTVGEEGNVMYDASYVYIYTSGAWRRLALSVIS